jgi:hypothetical protein
VALVLELFQFVISDLLDQFTSSALCGNYSLFYACDTPSFVCTAAKPALGGFTPSSWESHSDLFFPAVVQFSIDPRYNFPTCGTGVR